MIQVSDGADVASTAQLGEGTSVWHLAQIPEEAILGPECIVGRGAYIGRGVRMGKRCKLQNHALVLEPAVLEDGMFVGPAAVLTNDQYPRAITPGGRLKGGDDLIAVGVTARRGASIGPVSWYEHTDIGYNCRLSNMLAALGRAQLTRLGQMVAGRQAIRNAYVAGLGDLPGVRFLGAGQSLRSDNCWLTCIEVDPNQAVLSAAEPIGKLQAEDIEARHVWKPMHRQPVFSGRARW